MRHINIVVFLLLVSSNLVGQNAKNDSIQQSNNIQFKYGAIIVPSALIAYGLIGIENDGLKIFNSEIREEIIENIDGKFTIDDISQYVPFLSVYGLNAIGVKGKNNFKDRTIILGAAYLIMGSTVFCMKKITAIERPDGSSKTSFPSGHTATAFMGAEFLYQEYKDVSIWYGISGYVIAAGTGFFRLYNDRHWFTDVVAGAGIGIISTKIAYWLHPFMKRILFKDKDISNGVVFPFYRGKEYGIGLSVSF